MIYFDNAATTLPIYTSKTLYNPSSPHALGIEAERALRNARKTIASALCLTGKSSDLPAKTLSKINHIPAADEIIFTSGGTESNNLAILGFSLANQRHNTNLISSPHEHPSVLAPIYFACERGWAFTDDTNKGATLVSVSHVNHETGDINDLGSISAKIKKDNPSAVIHVDGAQGFCKENINLEDIDMYSFSGHKCHGPMGVGGLWVKKGIRLTPLQYGGGQENNRRSGTENIAAIVQMAEAAEYMSQRLLVNHTHITEIKAILLSLRDNLPDVYVNTLGGEVSPYILNMSFIGVKGEILVHALSEMGVYVSMGAACHSRKRVQSALEIMGFSPEIAQSAIRFSFSPHNTLEEATQARDMIIDAVTRLRNVIR